MSYGRLNNHVAMSELLSLDAKGLYGIICCMCGSKDYCYPSLSTLAKISGKSKSTVQRILKELSDKGVVTRGFNTTMNKTVTVNLLDPKKTKTNYEELKTHINNQNY
jgi:DNA-binding MarR family transcriptional regulator